MRHVRVLATDLLSRETGQQRMQQQRVPAGELAAGGKERSRRLAAKSAADQLGAGRRTERRRTQDGDTRLGGEAHSQRPVLGGAGSRFANGEHERYRQSFEPPDQMADEPE